MVKYMKWLTEPPDEQRIGNVLCTFGDDEKRVVNLGWVGKESYNTKKGVIAYMIVPSICDAECRGVWKSEFFGDDMPKKSGMYLCCFEDNLAYPQIIANRIYKFWYNGNTETFGGIVPLGWMDIPKPYAGKKKLEYKEAENND